MRRAIVAAVFLLTWCSMAAQAQDMESYQRWMMQQRDSQYQMMRQQVTRSQQMARPYDYTRRDPVIAQQGARLQQEAAQRSWYRGPNGDIQRGDMLTPQMRGRYQYMGVDPSRFVPTHKPAPLPPPRPSGYMGGGNGGR